MLNECPFCEAPFHGKPGDRVTCHHCDNSIVLLEKSYRVTCTNCGEEKLFRIGTKLDSAKTISQLNTLFCKKCMVPFRCGSNYDVPCPYCNKAFEYPLKSTAYECHKCNLWFSVDDNMDVDVEITCPHPPCGYEDIVALPLPGSNYLCPLCKYEWKISKEGNLIGGIRKEKPESDVVYYENLKTIGITHSWEWAFEPGDLYCDSCNTANDGYVDLDAECELCGANITYKTCKNCEVVEREIICPICESYSVHVKR